MQLWNSHQIVSVDEQKSDHIPHYLGYGLNFEYIGESVKDFEDGSQEY